MTRACLDPAWRGGLAGGAWLLGVGWQLQQADTLPVAWSMGLVVAALLLVALAASPRRTATGLATCCVALALAGFALTDLRTSWRLADQLDPALEGRDLVVTGVIAELPRLGPTGTRFVFEVESTQLEGRPIAGVPSRLTVGWFHGYDGELLLAGPPQPLVAGDRWQLPLRLKQPHGTMNPHGFDLELWLFEQGLRASGSVRPGAVRLAEGVAHPVERLRQRIRDALVVRVSDPAAAGVLAALAVGDQAAIGREDWELFRLTGVAHLMSISGLHVTMFAWLAALLIGRAWRASPRLMLALPAPVAARWGGLALAAAYALLAGWGVPAQRTVGMLAVVVILRSIGLRWPQPLVLGAAGLVVVLADPWALLQPGFWLSFVAVGVLIASDAVTGGAPAPGWRGTLRAALHTQLVATVGLAPLSLIFFQQVSVVGFVANLVAIPLVTLLITPLALLGMLWPPVWTAAAALVQGLMPGLELLAAWPGALWTAAAAPAWALVAGLAGGVLLVMPVPWRLRVLGLPLCLPLMLPAVDRPAEGRFETVVADIGQGTAVLVRTRRHLLVYDAGPAYSAESDAGARVLLPLLHARGERAVDRLVLSHQDSDHTGGAATLVAGLPVHATSSSLPDGHPLRERLPAHSRCDAGQRWGWDGVRFEMLHPAAQDHALPLKPNALSCVLRVTGADGRRLLLSGDIEAAQEAALVATHGPALAADLLLVPHHGSRTSSTPAFLDAVSPTIAVVQAGYRSRFGHPAPDVVARYRARGIEPVRSDRCGAYTWPAEGAKGICQRQAGRRYWHHGGAGPPG
jgi:competence protein ComEC